MVEMYRYISISQYRLVPECITWHCQVQHSGTVSFSHIVGIGLRLIKIELI